MDAERMAKLGARQTCGACGTAFYDLHKADAACPKCGAKESEPATRPPAKRKRAVKKAKGHYRGGLQRDRTEPEVRPNDDVVLEPLDDDDESAAAAVDLEP